MTQKIYKKNSLFTSYSFDKLDYELSVISTWAQNVTNGLQALQRDDEKLALNTVKPSALKFSVILLLAGAKSFNLRGNWATGTMYAQNDVVYQNGLLLACTTSHAANNFNTDYTTSGLWMAIDYVVALNGLAVYFQANGGALSSGYVGNILYAGTVATQLNTLIQQSKTAADQNGADAIAIQNPLPNLEVDLAVFDLATINNYANKKDYPALIADFTASQQQFTISTDTAKLLFFYNQKGLRHGSFDGSRFTVTTENEAVTFFDFILLFQPNPASASVAATVIIKKNGSDILRDVALRAETFNKSVKVVLKKGDYIEVFLLNQTFGQSFQVLSGSIGVLPILS